MIIANVIDYKRKILPFETGRIPKNRTFIILTFCEHRVKINCSFSPYLFIRPILLFQLLFFHVSSC